MFVWGQTRQFGLVGTGIVYHIGFGNAGHHVRVGNNQIVAATNPDPSMALPQP